MALSRRINGNYPNFDLTLRRYARMMNSPVALSLPIDSDINALRLGMARGDDMAVGCVPVLHHLLGNDDKSLFSDDIIALIRGMLADVARQICMMADDFEGDQPPVAGDHLRIAAIVPQVMQVPGLLTHLHATALEWQISLRLQTGIGLDPVLSPLVQSLIASQDGAIGVSAMKLLAAQARFIQNQRHMRLPMSELPADLLHGLLAATRTVFQTEGSAAETSMRAQYDESVTRLGLLAQLISSMGAGQIAALQLTHAGTALFASALAAGYAPGPAGNHLTRDGALMAMMQRHSARLALTLRMAGVKMSAISENYHALGHEAIFLEHVAALSPERAKQMLSETAQAKLGAE
ncbi:MAG: hypothetical protein RLY97_682 [Pseudomonadota bacterium]